MNMRMHHSHNPRLKDSVARAGFKKNSGINAGNVEWGEGTTTMAFADSTVMELTVHVYILLLVTE